MKTSMVSKTVLRLSIPNRWGVMHLTFPYNRGAAVLRLWDGDLKNMLFSSYIVSHFSRRFVKKTAGIWTLLRLGDLEQVHGVPENSCNPSENDSLCA